MDQFKTKPYTHQLVALERSALEEFYALLMEQGTGKSWVLIYTAVTLWRAHLIDTLLIIAPKGVAPAWIREQLPTHMPEDVPYVSALWRASMTQAQAKDVHRTLHTQDGKLRIVVMNAEAFGATEKAATFAMDFLDSGWSALLAVDESHRIKNYNAKTTQSILKHLKPRAAYRRILTGTVADSPFDIYPQFNFLSSAILGSDSYVEFRNQYAVMHSAESGLIKHIMAKSRKVWKGRYVDDVTGRVDDSPMNEDGTRRSKHMEYPYLPAVVVKDSKGRPKYKNLDKLKKLYEPFAYRVLKKDCLDLPEKIYNRHYTELTDQQQELYSRVTEEQRIDWADGQVTVLSKLALALRQQQIVCGYLPDPERSGFVKPLFPSWAENPRVVSVMDYLEDRAPTERAIIWCRFIQDIYYLTDALQEAYGERSVVQFYGAVKDKQRAENVERFQGTRIFMRRDGTVERTEEVPEAERPRFLLAQQRAGGVGQTWTAANLSFHYSNTFSLIDRLQAEDRPHRIGQRNIVQYIDLEADGTIDSLIINAMRNKKDVADMLNGDEGLEWIR